MNLRIPPNVGQPFQAVHKEVNLIEFEGAKALIGSEAHGLPTLKRGLVTFSQTSQFPAEMTYWQKGSR